MPGSIILSPHQPPHTAIVVGDFMLDVVISGSYTKFANEAPLPVFCESTMAYHLGGSGNVVANLVSLGLTVIPVGIRGDDLAGDTLCTLLTKLQAPSHTLLVDSARPTTTKTRYYISNTPVFRTDNESSRSITAEQEDSIVRTVENAIQSNNHTTVKLVLSDYNKGCFTPRLRQSLIALARRYNVASFVDPKAPLEQYSGATVIKPNIHEAMRLGGVRYNSIDDLVTAHTHIATTANCEWSLITLSDKGMSLGNATTHTYRNATDSIEVIDVTGAGDIVLSVITALWGCGLSTETLLDTANTLARISVTHRGTYVLTRRDLEQVHLAPETVVFTNGCFDILHVGHLNLLRYAKSLGTRLIVALNSDASVQRLKGPTRPVRSQEQRKEMILALPWVDEVRIFDEDTPERLLSEVRPSILVKGGDYTPESVLGREYANEVRIFPFISGHSTSSILQSAKDKSTTL